MLPILLFSTLIIFFFIQSECFLPGTARPGLEIQNPFIQQPIATLPLGNSVTTSMVHTTLDGALFLFAATTNGSLHQVRKNHIILCYTHKNGVPGKHPCITYYFVQHRCLAEMETVYIHLYGNCYMWYMGWGTCLCHYCTRQIITPRACTRGKAIGLSVCRYCRCHCRRRHENCQISRSRHLCVL